MLFLLFGIIGFPKHFSKYSNKIFNNWQLFTLLVIRAKTKQSPEDLMEQILPGNTGLLKALGLRKIPTASALRKFARRLKAKWGHFALGGCAALAGLKEVISGIDGTGHSKLKGSKHYYKRTGKKAEEMRVRAEAEAEKAKEQASGGMNGKPGMNMTPEMMKRFQSMRGGKPGTGQGGVRDTAARRRMVRQVEQQGSNGQAQTQTIKK